MSVLDARGHMQHVTGVYVLDVVIIRVVGSIIQDTSVILDPCLAMSEVISEVSILVST